MSRRRGHKGEVAFQLFSFLDVLLCTIGALIIILTITIHRARANAREELARQAAPSPEVLKKQQEALEEARWRQDVLEQQRKERQDALQETRLALSHLEDHIRRLNEKGKELMALLEQIKAGKQTKEQDLAAARKELAKIKDELAKKKDELDKKKKEATSAEKWYALIPYDGPNGTRRMPIYVECVAEGVVIQPEGVLLTADDFRGEPSPGNPLDAALRTKREYIMKATGGKAAEPYPLLVVRPSGVLSYGAARACMKFWEDEFGYELIAEDKNLDFGPRDPHLDQIMNREIAQARKRQAVMAMAMPRKYTHEDTPRSFAPEDNPEVVRRRETVAGGGVGNGGSGTGVGGSNAGRGGGLGSGNGGNGGMGVGGTGPAGNGLAGTGGTGPRGAAGAGMPRGTGTGGTGTGTGPYGSSGDLLVAQASGGSAGAGAAGMGNGGTGTGTGGSGGPGPGGAGPGGTNPGGTSGGGNPGAAKAGNPRLTQPNQGGNSPGSGPYADGVPGGTSAAGGTSRNGAAGSNSNSQANSSGGTSSAGGTSGGSSGGASGGTPGGAGAGSTGSPSGGQSMPNIGMTMGTTDRAPPAGSQKSGRGGQGSGKTAKGKNWGLPEAQRHVSGVTRPISVTIQKDKLILLPERADQRRPQEIPLSPEMSPQELEALVSGVQRQMRSWGIALDGGYWKPSLSVDVRPGAEDRFAELKSNLTGSGIEVQRKIR